MLKHVKKGCDFGSSHPIKYMSYGNDGCTLKGIGILNIIFLTLECFVVKSVLLQIIFLLP